MVNVSLEANLHVVL